ncbi:hypothetical protein F2Q69_00012622 [Brassica cretica]|uniref:Uncharacterized protein n=1 Tax=Brassica cretica TaxID=69181 RepID=A0A8S9R3X1_BRACR|nr:hypothetical protein F2Q69_00012622 [Brassica cretica]
MNWSRSWSKFCDSDRILPNPLHSTSGPWCWVGRSVMFLFDCWLAGWPFISNPWWIKTLKWREFEAKPKPEAKEERQIQRTGLWYGLDRWGETRLRWERTSSRVGKTKIEKMVGLIRNEHGPVRIMGNQCYCRATVRDDPAIIQLKPIVEALRRTFKEQLWTAHVALPDHGVGLDGQSCSCLIVGWPVGLSSPTLGVDRPGGSSRLNPNPKRKRRDRFRELGCGMDWTDGGETRLHWERTSSRVGKTKIEKMVGVIRNEHGQVRIMGNQSVMAEQQYEMIQRSFN